MTSTRTYRCNLCRDELTAETGIGVYFVSLPTYIIEKPVREAENHICNKCRQAMVRLERLMHSPQPPQEEKE